MKVDVAAPGAIASEGRPPSSAGMIAFGVAIPRELHSGSVFDDGSNSWIRHLPVRPALRRPVVTGPTDECVVVASWRSTPRRPRVPPLPGLLTRFRPRRVGLDPTRHRSDPRRRRARPDSPFVSVWKRMIPRHVARKHRRLVDQIWIEVLIAEAGLRSMKGRVSQVVTAGFRQDLGVDPGHLLCESSEFGQSDVSGHRVSRSSNSLSRSRIRLIRVQRTRHLPSELVFPW